MNTGDVIEERNVDAMRSGNQITKEVHVFQARPSQSRPIYRDLISLCIGEVGVHLTEHANNHVRQLNAGLSFGVRKSKVCIPAFRNSSMSIYSEPTLLEPPRRPFWPVS